MLKTEIIYTLNSLLSNYFTIIYTCEAIYANYILRLYMYS